jgi:hypothetical protein
LQSMGLRVGAGFDLDQRGESSSFQGAER